MVTGKRLLHIGCGVYGEFVARKLLSTGLFSKVTLADLDYAAASQLAEKLKDSGCEVSAAQVDATDRKALADLYRGVDLVANITGAYEHTAVPTIEAAISSGVDYIDINNDFPSTRTVLGLDKDAREAGITVLIGFGDTPGIINIVARYAADQLDQVDEIHFAAGGSAGYHVAEGVERIWKKVINDPAIIYREGQLIEVPACTEKEYIRLVAGVAEEFEVMLAKQPMVLTVPRHIPGIREVTYKIGFTPTALGNDITCALRGWGMDSEVPIEVKGSRIKPVDFAAAFLASDAHVQRLKLKEQPLLSGLFVRALGSKNGQPMSLIYQLRDPQASLTQCTCATAARLLAEGEIDLKGVLAPEALNPQPFLQMAIGEGITVEETINQRL
jgi:saccharopine dehydrogenase (NAD+, L-lysine-forming)